jgi:indole-3-glycerol phosphate synthase
MSILDRIVAAKRREIAQRRSDRPEQQLQRALVDAPPVRDFFARLSADGPIKLIAEVKKASPSKGVIRQNFNPVEIAQTYEANGATCISVLTDVPFFQGKLEDLMAIRQNCSLPLLRKDFILDQYQLLEARVAGADAVLLIAECLDDCHLRSLHNQAVELGLTPLVEFYEPENLPRVLEAGATLIGVNNRDLRSFRTDLQHTIRMRKQIPANVLLVAESGIHGREDVQALESADVDAMLVGEHLMASPDVGAAVRVLLGRLTE